MAIENGPEDEFPIENRNFPASHVIVYQAGYHFWVPFPNSAVKVKPTGSLLSATVVEPRMEGPEVV